MKIKSTMTEMDSAEVIKEWAELKARTPLGAVSVKARKFDHSEDVKPMCGVMVNPPLLMADMRAMEDELVRTNGDCLLIPQGFAEEVIVIGHGFYPAPNEYFIWRGTAPEFNEYWRVD